MVDLYFRVRRRDQDCIGEASRQLNES